MPELLTCPRDLRPLRQEGPRLRCPDNHEYRRGSHGFWEVAVPGNPMLAVETTSIHCAAIQESGGVRVYETYVRPWLCGEGARRVLDAGCGVGVGVAAMRRDGFEAVGVDVRSVARLWADQGHDVDGFVVGDVTALPFETNAFDAALALGVLEHVGTRTGHLTLGPDYRAQRHTFAAELRRVVRPGGRLLIACPNKSFPIDVQHGPNDDLTYAPWRTKLFERTGLNVHRTWGDYHLATYKDLRGWFGATRVRPLPLVGYFGFSAFAKPGPIAALRRLAQGYVNTLPAPLRATALNPYVLAEVRC